MYPLIAATAYIKLDCIDGLTACMNKTQFLALSEPHYSVFQTFLNLWVLG